MDQNYVETSLPKLKVYKTKSREGVVERKVDDYSIVCRGLFKKETNMEAFVGLKVNLSSGELGTIEGSFGQSGKFKVRIPSKLIKIINVYPKLFNSFFLELHAKKWSNVMALYPIKHNMLPMLDNHFD